MPRATPDHERKAYDLLIQAEAGLAGVTGSAESGPSRVGISICDISTGQAAYAAILEALLRRERTGQGSRTSSCPSSTPSPNIMNVPYLARRYGGKEPRRLGLAHPSIAPYGVFRPRDGDIVLSIQNEREWAVLCERCSVAPPWRPIRVSLATRTASRNRDELDRRIQDRLRRTVDGRAVRDARSRRGSPMAASRPMGDLAGHRSATVAKCETPAGTGRVARAAGDRRRRAAGAWPRARSASTTARCASEFAGRPSRGLRHALAGGDAA